MLKIYRDTEDTVRSGGANDNLPCPVTWLDFLNANEAEIEFVILKLTPTKSRLISRKQLGMIDRAEQRRIERRGLAMAGKTVFGFGLLLIVAGLIWAAQGSGYFPYPAESFMVNQRPWIFRGMITAVFGLVLLLWSRRV